MLHAHYVNVHVLGCRVWEVLYNNTWSYHECNVTVYWKVHEAKSVSFIPRPPPFSLFCLYLSGTTLTSMHYCGCKQKMGESREWSYLQIQQYNHLCGSKATATKNCLIHICLKSYHSSTWEYDLGKVILRSHVEELGRRMASVKCRLGVYSKPAPGILLAPDINCRMSQRATPDLPSKQNSKQTNKQAS